MNVDISTRKNRFSVVIPVFNHEGRIADVVKAAKKLQFPVIVVDDGSTDQSYENIKNIKDIIIERHAINKGKGAALITGFKKAAEVADWAITIDADGQHDPLDTESLLEVLHTWQNDNASLSSQKGTALRPIIVGSRQDMVGPDVPWTSRFGRQFSNFWVWTSGGPMIADSQSGFRMYPVPEVTWLDVKSQRFQFEVEVIAKAGWKKMPVIEAPITVSYRPGMERISHFRPFVDFMRNSSTFCRLIFQRILVPWFVRRRLRGDASCKGYFTF